MRDILYKIEVYCQNNCYSHIKLKSIVKIIDKLMQTWNLKAHVVRNIVRT